MKYKNIVFDFGNVLGLFDAKTILSHFCDEENIPIFSKAVFYDWQALDEGSIAYEDYIRHALSLLPPALHENAERFFRDWHKQLTPITEIWHLIHELKEQNYGIYLLSNAPEYFADHADYYEILKEFDGIVFSAPVHMAKPNAKIYQHLFHKYQLHPQECFFIDDREDNVAAAKAEGMDGIVFTGDVAAVKGKIIS